MKLYTQTDITKSNTSVLQEITIEKLLTEIRSDKIKETIDGLRKVKNLSVESYNIIKRKLPYFIGAKFNTNIRNSANFEQIDYFVIDIDKYGDKEQVEKLKKQISEDSRLFMSFISPGGDGLKLVYILDKPITSLKKYSDFYKAFTLKLTMQYHLEKSIDFTTSDATRICFLSYDKNCYLNTNAEKVHSNLYIPEFDLLNQPAFIQEEKTKDGLKKNKNTTITTEQYKEILAKLNSKTPKHEKKYIVPEILNVVAEKLKKEFQKYHLHIESITDISYGKKIMVKDGVVFASFNVFYGKNGFSVVKTPVRNSNEALLEVCVRITENLLYSNNVSPHLTVLKNEKEESTSSIYRTDEEDKKGGVIQLKTAR